MTTAELSKLHTARPFQRFSIRLGDGQSLEVAHSEMLSYAPRSRTAVVFRPAGSFEIIDLLLVTSLEVHAGRNGKQPQRHG